MIVTEQSVQTYDGRPISGIDRNSLKKLVSRSATHPVTTYNFILDHLLQSPNLLHR